MFGWSLINNRDIHVNPYAPPESESSVMNASSSHFNRGIKRGPSLYIVLTGLLGGILSPLLLLHREFSEIGIALPLIGCVLGGIVYRIRSRSWPVDPSVRTRQLKYIACLLFVLPGTIGMFTGVRGQGVGFILLGAIIGFTVSCGILISGLRRSSKTP